MLIVSGVFVVDPQDREEFLAQRVASMTATRQEAGCYEYVMSADPVDPTRVMLYERWEDQASLDAHMAGLADRPRPGGPAPTSVSAQVYEIAASRSLI